MFRQAFDLGLDRARVLADDVVEPRVLVTHGLPDHLRRELDRGQRVLDLVGDLTGHLRVQGQATAREQLGDVVEDHQPARCARLEARR